MKKLHNEGNSTVKLGYMPDCDSDRGNIVYWSDDNQPKILKAQEVFSLSVLQFFTNSKVKSFKILNSFCIESSGQKAFNK